MIELDYIFLIMNCKKYRFKAIKQKSGWLKDLPNNLGLIISSIISISIGVLIELKLFNSKIN